MGSNTIEYHSGLWLVKYSGNSRVWLIVILQEERRIQHLYSHFSCFTHVLSYNQGLFQKLIGFPKLFKKDGSVIQRSFHATAVAFVPVIWLMVSKGNSHNCLSSAISYCQLLRHCKRHFVPLL